MVGGVCSACPAGRICANGDATACPTGYLCANGVLGSVCPDGYLCANGLLGAQCGAGSYCFDGAVQGASGGFVAVPAPAALPLQYQPLLMISSDFLPLFSGVCVPGYYCPAGSYNSTAVVCPIGSYCTGGLRYLCGPGSECGTVGTSTPGSCGGASFYCINGIQTLVPTGAYSIPEAAAATNRSGFAGCPVGSYCASGVKSLCGPGFYGAAVNLSTSVCSGQCR